MIKLTGLLVCIYTGQNSVKSVRIKYVIGILIELTHEKL
jgi:hypothetical protein